MRPRIFNAVCASALLLGSLANAQDVDVGQATYNQYCATCHGANGTGDGPMTEIITASVPDLTTLASENEGVFPMLSVIHVIDGRTGLRAHGGPMPVYGALFDAENRTDTPYSDVLYTRGKMLSVAYYLESIQK